MKTRLFHIQILLTSLTLHLAMPAHSLENKLVSGWVEDVLLNSEDFKLNAKIDTGADHSSINAEYIIQQDPEYDTDMITFTIRNTQGESRTYVRPVARYAKIKRKGKEAQTRPVVIIDVCMGSIRRAVEANLVDRKNFKYNMLIGRSYMDGYFLVDPSTTHRLTPSCEIEHE